MIESIYIHIPFCDSICTYCDFCKFLTNHHWIIKYLDALEKEIKLNYKNEKIDTLYIGGGTPSSLNMEELNKLFEIINMINFSKNYEFTFECNIESISKEKLQLLYNKGVNRLSIGVQTFNTKYLKYLNRNHSKEDVIDKINIAKKIGFKNINIDLIYALENETLNELKNDIDMFLNLDISHISTYSLIIEPNTKLYINKSKNIDEDLDFEMYELIEKELLNNGYDHYEISNFAKEGYYSKHNLTYWNNDEYYGFGLGASGYVNGTRYENTRNFNKYLKGDYILESNLLSMREQLQNEFILGFRKIKGINKKNFYDKYNIDIKSIDKIQELLNSNKLLEDKKNIYISPKYIYISNEILVEFID